jgi:hypothetical protein
LSGTLPSSQIGLGRGDDRVERLRAMADLHHGHADAGQRHQIALRLLENLDRHHGRPCREVVDACGHMGGMRLKP